MLRAIEPSDGMRDVWMKTINDKCSPIVKGTFENTGVEDGWADLIIIAQVSSINVRVGGGIHPSDIIISLVLQLWESIG
jgi:hypothetical protein